MTNFFAELKRRQMFRVAAAYAVVAWVLLQFANNITPALRLPEWMPTAVVVLLIIGFPVALLFCWIQQLGPGGESSKATAGRLDWVLIAALIVVIGLVSYQQLASNGAATVEQQAGVVAARSASLAPAGVAVAVLPFANVGADPEQEFFSDGITDEISGALAKIPDLRVVARTSAFQYKTRNTDIRSIGQALNATHLIDGSVRSAGGRIRIGVQLILADSGLQLWSENYDRELTDVFAIQEDIARAIASSLNMQLGLRPGENLITNRDIDPAAYQEFLRARAQVRGRLGGQADVRQLVARNPSFAPAWGLLAQGLLALQGLDNQLMNRPVDETRNLLKSRLEEAEKAAREAIRLDPQLPTAHGVLANIEFHRWNWAVAEDLYLKALALDSSDPDTLTTYATALVMVGRTEDGLQQRERVHDLEPFVPNYNNLLGGALLIAGQNEAAIRVLEANHPTGAQLSFRNERLSRAYAAAGRFREAADTILAIDANRNGDAGASRDAAARLMRTAPASSSSPEALPVLPGRLSFVYAYVGATERMLEYPERGVETGFNQPLQGIWEPLYAPLRKTERFKILIRKARLVDYWKARGWPDLCKPVGANDFACE